MTEDERAYWVEEREDQRKDDKLVDDFERQEREIKRLRGEIELRKQDRELLYSEYEKALNEISFLKIEIERYTKQLDKATKAMERWAPAMGRNGRMNVGGLVEILVAEIERKDNALNELRQHIKQAHKMLSSIENPYKADTISHKVWQSQIDYLETLSTEEVSDEQSN